MTQTENEIVVITAEDALKQAQDFLKEHEANTGKVIEMDHFLITNLKQYNADIQRLYLGIQEIRFINVSSHSTLSTLKAQRTVADRNGGGDATAKLTRKINAGRRIVNQARQDLEVTRFNLKGAKSHRDALLGALRLYYSQLG